MVEAEARMSTEPLAVTVVCATLCQNSEPPAMVGSVGPERSIRAVLEGVAPDGTHGVALPAMSSARNCTSVSPSVATTSLEPAIGVDQVEPPLCDSRYW